jgi:hypothetical protein
MLLFHVQTYIDLEYTLLAAYSGDFLVFLLDDVTTLLVGVIFFIQFLSSCIYLYLVFVCLVLILCDGKEFNKSGLLEYG